MTIVITFHTSLENDRKKKINSLETSRCISINSSDRNKTIFGLASSPVSSKKVKCDWSSDHTLLRDMDSGHSPLKFMSSFCHFLALWPWAYHLTSMWPSFIICKMEIIVDLMHKGIMTINVLIYAILGSRADSYGMLVISLFLQLL